MAKQLQLFQLQKFQAEHFKQQFVLTEKPSYHPWQREWVEIRENSTGPRGKRTVQPEKADRNQPRLNKFGPIPVRELSRKTQRESTQISVIWIASRVGILTRKAAPEATQKEEN